MSQVVEEMHFAFIYAEEHHDSCTPQNVQTVWKWCEQDGAADALNAWKRPHGPKFQNLPV